MIDWDDLRYLVAVQRSGSLASAARALGADKGTVSRRIAALERSLRVRLFDRRPRGYTLTGYGRRVVEAAGQVDHTVSGLLADLQAQSGEERGTVLLTVPQWFANELLVPELPAFRARHPHIALVLNASSKVLNIAQREAEVGLRNTRPRHLSVTTRKAGRLASALYGARGYLADRGTPRTREDLALHDLIGYENTLSFLPDFAWLESVGAPKVRGNDAASLCACARAGLGLAVLPCVLGDAYAELARVSAFGVAGEDIWVVAPGELRPSPRVRAVVELLLAVFKKRAPQLAGVIRSRR